MQKLIVAVFVAVVSLALSGLAFATDLSDKAKTSKNETAKTVPHKHASAKVKPSVAKATTKPTVAAAVPMTASPVADAQVQEAVATKVHTGHMACELGNSVTVTPDPHQSARFIVQMKKYTYLMTPVETTTGAVRLEDAQAGAMWLQLPHKSMLMNSKLGQRMADECQGEHQIAVAQRMKLDPPPSLLDQPALAKK